jgi:hypothetical protein
MTAISQILAVVGGVKNDTDHQLTGLLHDVTQPELVSGLIKTYRPRAEPRPGETILMRPSEQQRVQVTVDDVLAKTAALLTRQWDVARTLDEAKTRAKADVVVDGYAILVDVTTDHLIYLEGQLATLYGIVSKLPVLNPAETWTDEDTEPGQHRTPPVEKTSNDTVYFNHVLAEATEHHPAQVQVMKRDEVVGYWTTVKFSGAMEARAKRRLLDRITKLQHAVKFAREEANTTPVTDIHEGERIFTWLND